MQTKLEVGIMGESKPTNQQKEKTIHSLHQFINYISRMTLQDELRQEIIKYASKYPEGALDNIYINIEKIKMKCLGVIAARNHVTMNSVPEPPETAIGDIKIPEIVIGSPKMSIGDIKIPEMSIPKMVESPPPVIQPQKQKWTTMSAAEVLKQSKALNNKQIQLPINPEEEKAEKAAKEFIEKQQKMEKLSKTNPEEYKRLLLEELKNNPPKEASIKENEDDDYEY